MKRNCNPELRLVPLSDGGHWDPSLMDKSSSGSGSPQQEQLQHQQQLTIFYNGRVSVFDVTEFQARAILSFARREMENKLAAQTPTEWGLPSQLCCPMAKRSIQRFLQKRNGRTGSSK